MKQILLFALIFFVVITLFMYFFQRHMMYFPAHDKPDITPIAVKGWQEVELVTNDGLRIYSWYAPPQPQNPVILYFHGNAGHIAYRLPLVRQFTESGFGVLLLEYRGYGGNEGEPSEKGLYQDGHAAMAFLHQQQISANDILFYGESLGSGVAVHLAQKYPVCAVVLQSPFTSMADLARYHYPWAILKPWDRYNSLEKIQSIKTPLLILHGKQDQIVPITQARRLYEKAKEPKQFAEFEEGAHNNLWQMKGYVERVLRFSHEHCQ